ncbi:MAG: biotin--[acetyl-CoA-carboxylase] ligase [Acidobacteriota bacterium]
MPGRTREAAGPLTPGRVRQGLSTRVMGREVVCFDTIDSTNKVLRQAAARGAVEGTVVIANEQTGGRGRLNRTWVSPPGVGIYLSILLRPPGPPGPVHLFTFLPAVATARALRHVSGLPVFIQWPNDVMLRGRKIAGILSELRGAENRSREVIIGIGINVNHTAADFPVGIRDSATSLALSSGRRFSRTAVVQCLLREMDQGYALLHSPDPSPIVEEWRRLCPSHYGKPVVVGGRAAGVIRGTTRGIDTNGALLVERANGGLERVSFGEVRRVRGG